MEEKKQITIKLNTLIIILVAVVVALGGAMFFTINNINKHEEDVTKSVSDNINIETYNNKEYYIIKGDYSGEYDLQYIMLSQYINSPSNEEEAFKKKELMSYSEYEAYCNEWGLEKVYSDTTKNYIVFSYISYDSSNIDARLAAVDYNGENVDIYIWDDTLGFTVDISAYCIVIPTEKTVNNINIVGVYTSEEFNNIKKYNIPFTPDNPNLDKPVIYLYPTEEKEISVKLLNVERITCSYPKYVDGWKVLAKPNGDLMDLDTGRNLYSLYYESESVEKFNVSQEGFVVRGEESAKFLEEKLEVLGLTEREAEEFIIYWLPKLESNKYNYIRFATSEEINNNMPLEISPKPDTIIRVLMIFKGLENPIEVEEQRLTSLARKGFTVVEWGGTEIKY